jgi:magnesium and cobalt exporter, CNNM family
VIEILIILLLLLANGFFAMSEIAIISARKAHLQQLAKSGNAKARAALDLATNPDRFLATVQIGITLIGIFAGAFSGATIADRIGSYLGTFPLLAPYSKTIGVGSVVVGLTYLSLVIGELVPKRLALGNAERIAPSVAPAMRTLSTIASPIVHLLSASSNLVIKLLGVKSLPKPTTTPEEIRVLVQLGRESGIFEESEQDMIEGVLRLDERPVGGFITPRKQIVWFDLNDTPKDILQKLEKSRHSRYPVMHGSLDTVLGIVRAKDILAQCLASRPLDLKAILRPPLFFPETISSLKALELFKQKGAHIALVIDEYGGIEGIVTHNDILEAIVGYIPSAGEPVQPQATRRDDGSWLVDGLLHIDELREIFELDKMPEGAYSVYHTVGGFVISQLRTIPSPGQSFRWENLRFEVVDMDGRRVDKILVVPIKKGSRQEEGIDKALVG